MDNHITSARALHGIDHANAVSAALDAVIAAQDSWTAAQTRRKAPAPTTSMRSISAPAPGFAGIPTTLRRSIWRPSSACRRPVRHPGRPVRHPGRTIARSTGVPSDARQTL